MIEILPIRLLSDEDSLIFGKSNVDLGKLHRAGLPVANGIVVAAPEVKLKAVLEHYDFGVKEVFEQSLTLVKKEIYSIPPPEQLVKETEKHKKFLLNGEVYKRSLKASAKSKLSGFAYKSVKNLWQGLLEAWLEQIKSRLWQSGFYPGLTTGLDSQAVLFIKKIEGIGRAYFDPVLEDVEIFQKFGKLHPADMKKLTGTVLSANKKLFIPHEYIWILDKGVKLAGLRPYTQPITSKGVVFKDTPCKDTPYEAKCAVKVFFDSSDYIQAEKIFDLNRPNESFDDMVFKLVESATTFPDKPIFFKLADMSEGLGKIRGTLRLLHQKSLLDPMIEALDFARHKQNLTNIHIVIPFVRGVSELLQIKRELAAGKLARKNSLQIWMEVCTPENIINLEKYLEAGIDGVVLNLNELISFCNGFDPSEGDLAYYKSEVNGLLKFLEDALKLLHKSKVPFIACGSICFESKVLEFLVEKGVYGVVAEKFEAHSAKDLLHQVEKRVILRKTI